MILKPSAWFIESIGPFSLKTCPSTSWDAVGAGEFDHVLHQLPAQALALHVGAQRTAYSPFSWLASNMRRTTPSISPVSSSTATLTNERE